MAGAAKPRTRIGKRIQDESFKTKELYSLNRRSDTPTQIQPSFSASASAGTNNGDVNFLPTAGGTMIGALAFFPKLLTISSGAIDISKNTIDYTSRVIVSPESGSTDDLTTITGAAHAGQLLFLQGVETDTITIKTSGNIETIDGADFTLEDDDILIFMFDTTDNKWQQVTTGKQGVLAGGSFISASLSADQTTNIAATNHVEFDTTDSGTLVLQTGSGQADGIFELLSGKTYVLNASLRPEFSGATGSLVVAWYDITNTAELGKRAIYEPVTQTTDDANQPSCQYVFTPASDITVELRIISVTALTALANEYCHAVIFGAGAGSGGGGGAISFPITPTINDHGNVGTTTEDIDLSLSTGHVHKITLTGNPTLTFSNPPASGTQIEFEIEFIQDATGGRTVTWPASVVENVSISLTASTTTIVTVRTNDGGTNYHAIPALRGSISLSGGSVYASLALDNLVSPTLNTDLDFNSFDAKNVDRLELVSSEGSPSTAATPTLYLGSTGDMIANVATGDKFAVTVNDSATVPFSVSATSIIGIDFLPLGTNELGASGVEWDKLFVNTVNTDVLISTVGTASTSGFIQIGNGEFIGWRDAGNTADALLSFNSSDRFMFGNYPVVPTSSGGTTLGVSGVRWGTFYGNSIDITSIVCTGNALIQGSASSIGNADTDVLTIRGEFILNDITAPSAPGAAKGTLYLDASDDVLKFIHSDSSVSDLEGGLTSLTPWTETVDAASNVLDNVSRINQDGTVPTAGFLNLANSSTIAWEAAPASTDGTLSFSASENFTFGGAVGYSVIHSLGGSLGTSGSRWGTLWNVAVDCSTILASGNVIFNGDSQFGNSSADTATFTADVVVNNAITFGSTNADTVSFTSKIDTDMGLVGGNVFKSNDTTEIGLQVTNASMTVGTKGSIQMPNATTGVSTTKAALSAAFGDIVGCFGIIEISSTLTLFVKQSNGNWGSVALTYDAITS